jgi:hypothetical protein
MHECMHACMYLLLNAFPLTIVSEAEVLCRLQLQYRMHPCISYLPSRMFYNGDLRDGIKASDRESPMHDPVREIVFPCMLHAWRCLHPLPLPCACLALPLPCLALPCLALALPATSWTSTHSSAASLHSARGFLVSLRLKVSQMLESQMLEQFFLFDVHRILRKL